MTHIRPYLAAPVPLSRKVEAGATSEEKARPSGAGLLKHYGGSVNALQGIEGRAQWGERPAPVCAAGQVRIRVRHAGVGFALSLFVSGKYQRKPPLPFTPGTEAAGEILEVAPDVTRLSVGQRVAAALDWGGFAEEVVTTADTVYPVPDGLALAHAAALPVTYGTVWAALAWRAWRYATPQAKDRARPAMLALAVTVFPLNTHLAFYSTFWGGLTVMLAALYAGSLLARDGE